MSQCRQIPFCMLFEYYFTEFLRLILILIYIHTDFQRYGSSLMFTLLETAPKANGSDVLTTKDT